MRALLSLVLVLVSFNANATIWDGSCWTQEATLSRVVYNTDYTEATVEGTIKYHCSSIVSRRNHWTNPTVRVEGLQALDATQVNTFTLKSLTSDANLHWQTANGFGWGEGGSGALPSNRVTAVYNFSSVINLARSRPGLYSLNYVFSYDTSVNWAGYGYNEKNTELPVYTITIPERECTIEHPSNMQINVDSVRKSSPYYYQTWEISSSGEGNIDMNHDDYVNIKLVVANSNIETPNPAKWQLRYYIDGVERTVTDRDVNGHDIYVGRNKEVSFNYDYLVLDTQDGWRNSDLANLRLEVTCRK